MHFDGNAAVVETEVAQVVHRAFDQQRATAEVVVVVQGHGTCVGQWLVTAAGQRACRRHRVVEVAAQVVSAWAEHETFAAEVDVTADLPAAAKDLDRRGAIVEIKLDEVPCCPHQRQLASTKTGVLVEHDGGPGAGPGARARAVKAGAVRLQHRREHRRRW
jgi:hypothetical protein